MVLEKIFFN